MRGMLFSLLGLTLLQAALSGRADASRLGEAGTAISAVLAAVIDPTKPAIPDFRPGHEKNSAPGSTTSSTTTAKATPAVITAPTPVVVPATGARTYIA